MKNVVALAAVTMTSLAACNANRRVGDMEATGKRPAAHFTVLTEQVSDRYLALLRSRGVSYLFGGKKQIDLPTVLRKLLARFGIRKMLLEGGGKINGSFLAAGVIDELSLLVAPVADGGIGTPTLFDAREGPGPARRLRLLSVERRRGDLLWVRYRVRVGRR